MVGLSSGLHRGCFEKLHLSQKKATHLKTVGSAEPAHLCNVLYRQDFRRFTIQVWPCSSFAPSPGEHHTAILMIRYDTSHLFHDANNLHAGFS